jgi:hypothetical protein
LNKVKPHKNRFFLILILNFLLLAKRTRAKMLFPFGELKNGDASILEVGTPILGR